MIDTSFCTLVYFVEIYDNLANALIIRHQTQNTTFSMETRAKRTNMKDCISNMRSAFVKLLKSRESVQIEIIVLSSTSKQFLVRCHYLPNDHLKTFCNTTSSGLLNLK